VVQLKNCPFGVNTTIELNNITTAPDNNDTERGIFQLKSVPVFSDVVVTFFSSIVVLAPNVQFFNWKVCRYCWM